MTAGIAEFKVAQLGGAAGEISVIPSRSKSGWDNLLHRDTFSLITASLRSLTKFGYFFRWSYISIIYLSLNDSYRTWGLILEVPKKIAVCIKDTAWNVLWQNSACRAVCGECRGGVCQRSCYTWFQEDPRATDGNIGIQVFRNREISGNCYDVAIACDGEEVQSVLCPTERKWKARKAHYEGIGLTARELEIKLLKDQRFSNRDVAGKCFISLATVKTHINHIRRKLKAVRNSR